MKPAQGKDNPKQELSDPKDRNPDRKKLMRCGRKFYFVEAKQTEKQSR